MPGKQGASAACYAHVEDENEPVVVLLVAAGRDSFRVELRIEDALLLGKGISDAADALKVALAKFEMDQQLYGTNEE